MPRPVSQPTTVSAPSSSPTVAITSWKLNQPATRTRTTASLTSAPSGRRPPGCVLPHSAGTDATGLRVPPAPDGAGGCRHDHHRRRARPRRDRGRAGPHPRHAPAPLRGTPGLLGPRPAPHGADQQRRGADRALLPGRARLPADRADREPRLPGFVALLLRHRPREPARVL